MMDMQELTDEEYFGALKMMFRTDGWEIFLAEMQDNATNINSVESTQDGDDLLYRKGQLAVIGNIINLERTILMAEEEATRDELEVDEED